MKKVTSLLCMLVLSLGIVATANALQFTVDKIASKVSLSNIDTFLWTSLTADLSLNPETFSLNEGQTRTIDFFTLTAEGFGLGRADISATLAFSSPETSTTGTADVRWGTIGGYISGGILAWNNYKTTNASGNLISVVFEDGVAIVCGDTATVHASITNHAGGTVSVPEPGTMLMLGSVLLGLVAVSRKRFNHKN